MTCEYHSGLHVKGLRSPCPRPARDEQAMGFRVHGAFNAAMYTHSRTQGHLSVQHAGSIICTPYTNLVSTCDHATNSNRGERKAKAMVPSGSLSGWYRQGLHVTYAKLVSLVGTVRSSCYVCQTGQPGWYR